MGRRLQKQLYYDIWEKQIILHILYDEFEDNTFEEADVG